MYRYIIFDIDGTMVDSEAVCIQAYKKIASERGICCNEDYIKDKCFVLTPRDAFKNLGMLNEREIEAALLRLNEYTYGAGEIKLYPGILETLRLIKSRGYKMAICTARDANEFDADPLFPLMRPFFDVIMDCNYAEYPKPSSAPMLKFLKDYHVQPEEVLFIGDSLSDYSCAKGSKVVFALPMWNKTVDRTLEANYLFERPEDILKILE